MKDVMQWLLLEDTPEIKYRTMLELENRDRDDVQLKKANEDLLASDMLKSVMEKFEKKDKWEHINAFLVLAECGLTREDVNVDAYVEQTIKELNRSTKCAKVLFLRNLVKLGYLEHPWVKEQIEESFSTIREDGTVHCLDMGKKRNDSKLPDMGCYRQTTTYLLLAAELKKQGINKPQFQQLKQFYMEHHVMFHKEAMDQFMIKEMTTTFYPIDHVHIGIQMILYALSILGVGKDACCKEAWEQLYGYKNERGRYILGESFKEPYFKVGKVGMENKWVTIYALLAEKYA